MGIESVKFRGRHNSWRAIVVLITGIAAFVTFWVLAGLSAHNGAATFGYGIAGIAATAVSLAGVIISAKAMQERDVFVSVPIAGMTVNGITFLMYVIIYVLGLV